MKNEVYWAVIDLCDIYITELYTSRKAARADKKDWSNLSDAAFVIRRVRLVDVKRKGAK